MSRKKRKGALSGRSTQDANEPSGDSSHTKVIKSMQRNNPTPNDARRKVHDLGGLRDRLRTSPRCPACGASIDLPNKACLVRCGECGCKALPDVYREWGAITDRVIGAIYSLGAWSDAELTIRSGDREVARIDIPERSATVDPSETRLATLLARYDLAIREEEVAA